MKKYLQITIVLAIFGLVVVFRQLKGNTQTPVVVSKDNLTPTPAAITPTGSSATQTPTPTLTPAPARGFKDGTYAGDTIDAFYGNVQVRAVISNGKITKVDFLKFPDDRGHTQEVSQMSIPVLQQEAIQVQNANVDIVSGATQTSDAFIKSLQSALDKAKS